MHAAQHVVDDPLGEQVGVTQEPVRDTAEGEFGQLAVDVREEQIDAEEFAGHASTGETKACAACSRKASRSNGAR